MPNEASPICRGQNLTLETVLMFIYAMPKSAMPKNDFNAFAESRMRGWTQTHSQIARQMALYYETNGICYPRFLGNVDIDDIVNYARKWACNYFIPNPYTPSLRGNKPTNIYAYLKSEIKKGNDVFDIACNSIFGITLNNLDKVRVYLNSFTDLIIDNNKMSLNDGISSFEEVPLNPFDEEIDAKTFYEKFNIVLKAKHSKSPQNLPLQQIYYGAPGTGKSDEIKRLTAEGGQFSKDFTFRTTFHPDSDYSTFVGAYKPIWSDEKDKIVYEFRPQAFLKAYVAAWTHPEQQVALVVEEINRGNCAQIFGDIFQLLDREKNGLSKYPIEADIDMQNFLFDALNGKINIDWAGDILADDIDEINACYAKHYNDAFDKIKNGKILTLPKNLSILATMNTSDQSLFPMDSAFKRRWDWIYQPIVEGVNKQTGNRLGWQIMIDGYKPIDWWAFIERINYVVSDLTKSEDKQLGYFFCMPDKDGETTISANRFVEKVIFYLWNDVFKDYSYDPECCNTSDGKGKLLYADFYNKENDTINADVIAHFINQLKTKDGKNDPLATEIEGVGDNNQQNDNAVVEEEADNTPDEPQQQSLFQ